MSEHNLQRCESTTSSGKSFGSLPFAWRLRRRKSTVVAPVTPIRVTPRQPKYEFHEFRTTSPRHKGDTVERGQFAPPIRADTLTEIVTRIATRSVSRTRNMTTPAQRQSRRPKNIGSDLLPEHENRLLWNMMGKGSYSLCAGICQLLATHPSPSYWSLQCSGVVVLVKDYTKRAYFIRIYDLYKRIMLWEQQLYDEFKMEAPAGVLLTFEGDTCVYGLNFSNASEAKTFKAHIDRRYEKEMADKHGSGGGRVQSRALPQTGHTQNNLMPHMGVAHNQSVSDAGSDKKKSKGKGKKKKIDKTDISLPSNFEHRVHLGWDQDSGFSQQASQLATDDPSVRDILRAIGIDSTADLSNGEVSKTIAQFAAAYGGIDQLKQKIINEQKVTPAAQPVSTGWDTPPHPSRQPPPSRPPPSYNQPPQQQYGGQTPTRAPVKTHAPPPPPPPPPREPMYNPQQQRQQPPGRPLPHPPSQPAPQVSTSRPGAVPPPPPPMGGPPPISSNAPPPPPPPPPPPMMGAGGPGRAPPANDNRGNLLAGIQNAGGVGSLKPVDKSAPSTPAPRDNLLKEIESGRKLNHVVPNENRHSGGSPLPGGDGGDIVNALRRALDKRRGAMESSEEEEDSDNENDWDDD